jgi:PAS domain S-box-containing protein
LRLENRTDGSVHCLFASAMSPVLFARPINEITDPDLDFRSLIQPDDLSVFLLAINKTTSVADQIDVQFRILNDVKGPIWVRSVGTKMRSANGTVICDIRMRNIEDRIAISEDRSRLQSLLDTVLDNVPLMISVRDVEQDCFIHVNRMFQRIAGIPKEKIIGQGTTGIFGTERSDTRRELTKKVVENREVVELPEIEFDSPHLGYRIFKSAKHPILDEEGDVRYVVSITDDITERRRAEEALRRNENHLEDAIESFSNSIALFDADDRLVLYNTRFKHIWPCGDFETQAGQTYETLLRAYSEEAVRNGSGMDVEAFVAKRINAHRNPPVTHELQLFNGTWLQISHRKTSEGGTVLTGTDITTLKEREEILRDAGIEAIKAKEAAEIANRSKSDFLANMSHELRTPLNAVIGFSEIIRDAIMGVDAIDQYRIYAQDIHVSGLHLLDLINDVLDMSKIEAGKLELNDETVALREPIELAIRLVGERAEQTNVALITDIEGDLQPMRGDMRKIKQIIINLLSNAVKFTPKGGSVTTCARRAANGDFIVDVTDTGIGIAEKDLPKIFEAFGQATSGFDRQYEGTGLGINLAKALTELHDGEFSLRSATAGPEKGTTATVRFPSSRAIG